jgi:pimeloyl-ACP methyl ester carboxylesterase
MPSDLTERTVENGDVRIQCMTGGSPDPVSRPMVVLLHGFPARWSTWRQIIPPLVQAGYFVVAPDLRGYGASDKPWMPDSYSVPRIAEDVVAIIRAFGHERAFVAGHDFGGGVAWALGMFHPDCVERLAILNSVHPVGFERQMRKPSQLAKSWYMFFFLLPRIPEWLLSRQDYQFLRRSLADDGLPEAVVADLLEGVRRPGALHAALEWYRTSLRDGARKRLIPKKVDKPVLVIWGDREAHLDAALANPPADWAPNVRVEHIAEGSHWVHHDAPDKVAALLVEHFGGR